MRDNITDAAPPASESKPEPATAPAEAEATTAPSESTNKEANEPQNSLTERFTTSEWNALKEFRKKLPEIFADGLPDKPDAKSAEITLWGVKIDPADPVDAKVSVVLMKFLRARNLNVNEARSMLVGTLRWRSEFNVEAAIKEEYPEDIFGSLGHVYGKDKQGRPVVYNIYGAKDIKTAFSDVRRFLRWRVALMEKSLALLDFETMDQTVQVHDYAGVSLSSRDANSKQAASEASGIFSDHYPELLYKKFFVNVPGYLTWIFWLFKPLISANTLAKMSVVGSGAPTIGKVLLPIIDAKELPKQYGGEAEGF
ncbi:CRAL/TRIO domain-containing protein [Guyanagaster necrorhizus]|uniref:Phosphatidylinositol transfer protein SFH5 n=1 Tax=Guyanagaster necrorhizus TaxID=856835 RepID=A0A9P8APN5_9AGAR|nr:CRAL/TRIO domain-containing protein [Guyanagaster necrorhizus MCA 3950]KAG7443538.1 CRAL/TRIO domain-containing protein [Guyanagaster necrorhizus MCA 3950]